MLHRGHPSRVKRLDESWPHGVHVLYTPVTYLGKKNIPLCKPALLLDPVESHFPLVHGVDRLPAPRSVHEAFNRRRSLASISAALPTGAPEVNGSHTASPGSPALSLDPRALLGAPPALLVWDAMAPGPAVGPAPAPGSEMHGFDAGQVKDFIQTLLLYRHSPP